MASNAQKTPFARSINRFAEKKIVDAIQVQGKALPASVIAVSGSIVTVKFEVQSGFTLPHVTCPAIGSEYVRLPIQVGDKGIVRPVDAYIGGMSGLGGGVAGLTLQANLSSLVWEPIGNTGFSAVSPSMLTLYGPGGAVLRDAANDASVTVTSSAITLTCAGHTLIINSAGISFDGKLFATHEHTNVQTGSSNTGIVA